MFKNICVIGVGTLGGFVCKHLAEQENVKELTIIDDDIVQAKNIHNSIYDASSLGEYKVDFLEYLLKNLLPIKKFRHKYFEGKTKLPACDLVIDCRDELYDRFNEIDVRLFISNKNLIFDCRKQLIYTNKYKGQYTIQLTKNDLSRAGFFAAQIIGGGSIKDFMKNEIIHSLNLDILPEIVRQSTESDIASRTDVIYEKDTQNIVHGLDRSLKNILEINKYQPIEVYVGEKENFLTRKTPRTNFAVIPKMALKNPVDLNNFFGNFLVRNNITKNFIIIFKKENNNYFIELLEETGAA